VSKAFVWLGALLFVVSLVSFLYVYEIRLSVPAAADGSSVVPAVLFNIGLFTVFALHHSVMARSGAKAWITRIVRHDLERSLYVWIASLLFLAVCWLWQPLPGIVWTTPNWTLRFLFGVVQGLGIGLTLRAAGMISVFELAGVRQANHQRPVEFTATGPFGLVRHPIYLGWILLVFASIPMTAGKLLFAVVSSAYLLAAIPWEEASLIEAFGDKYRTYQAQVKSRILPGLW
jgi:protein-S-isoprenylcysteine O-methyltransferase Ste14